MAGRVGGGQAWYICAKGSISEHEAHDPPKSNRGQELVTE